MHLFDSEIFNTIIYDYNKAGNKFDFVELAQPQSYALEFSSLLGNSEQAMIEVEYPHS